MRDSTFRGICVSFAICAITFVVFSCNSEQQNDNSTTFRDTHYYENEISRLNRELADREHRNHSDIIINIDEGDIPDYIFKAAQLKNMELKVKRKEKSNEIYGYFYKYVNLIVKVNKNMNELHMEGCRKTISLLKEEKESLKVENWNICSSEKFKSKKVEIHNGASIFDRKLEGYEKVILNN